MTYVIFTDLDGTLLDHYTYSFTAAMPALDDVRKFRIPLIAVSSKTRAELLIFRENLGLQAFPFVVENGSAFYTPPELFNLKIKPENRHGLWCYPLGKTYVDLIRILNDISSQRGHIIRGFHNAESSEIADRTGLKGDALHNALQREFSIPIFYEERSEQILREETEKYGLKLLYGGRFMHLLGKTDKGTALKMIMKGYKNKFEDSALQSVAIGDSQNDYSMLAAADIAILVKRHDGSYESRPGRPRVILSPEIGPLGWNLSVLSILKSGGYYE